MLGVLSNDAKDDWDDVHPFAVHAYNTSRHETTRHTTFSLVYGREAESTLDARLPSTGWGQNAKEVCRRTKKARALAELLALDAQNAAKRRWTPIGRRLPSRKAT